MPRQEPFTVDVMGTSVTGALHHPDPAPEGRPRPAVLICDDLDVPDGLAGLIAGELATALLEGGNSVATYAPAGLPSTASGDNGSSVLDLVDQASAVFRWLMLHRELDPDRLGVVGLGLGAMLAAGLAGRTEAIARLCLVAPFTPEVLARVTKGREAPSAANADSAPSASRWPDGLAEALNGVDGPGLASMHARPTLILHGAADRQVPPGAAAPYAQRLLEAGRNVEFLLVARADHAFTDAAVRAACIRRINGFFATIEPVTTTSPGP